MAKTAPVVPFTNIPIDPDSEAPLYRQLYEGLREAILTGRLPGRTRLPSTRILADELRISRNTVMNSFDQLLAEGYLEGRVGDGTYVAAVLPDELLNASTDGLAKRAEAGKGRTLSRRGAMLAATPVSPHRNHGTDHGKPVPFQTGLPALEAFPFETWARLMARRWRNPPYNMLGYGEPAGYRPLREAIAQYLGGARAVRCSPDQVIVVGGSQQALDLAARLLLDDGDAVWVEDPCYIGARGALAGAGAELVAVPVDDEGLNVSEGVARRPDAKMVYVTPSHQFPLGVTMTLSRRLALLEWASRQGAWVLEDDYDSEYRYGGRPLAALQGLDGDGRVIYIGTFSKVLLPSLRLGYVVVPEDLVDSFIAARALADRHSPQLEQAVLTDFITEGHFSRHIRRMRALYEERQDALLESVAREIGDGLEVRETEAGMHLVGFLPEGVSDTEASRAVSQIGLKAPALSIYGLETVRRGGLVLGFSAVTPKEITAGVKKLARVLARKTD